MYICRGNRCVYVERTDMHRIQVCICRVTGVLDAVVYM